MMFFCGQSFSFAAISKRKYNITAMATIEEILEKIEQDKFEFSQHALDQSIIHHINMRNLKGQSPIWKETMVEKRVTYTLEFEGRFIIVENVPARVCLETGERFFSPQTVERVQQIIWDQEQPIRVVQTPVYEFA